VKNRLCQSSFYRLAKSNSPSPSMLADLMRPHEGGGEKLLLVPLPCDCSLLLLPATLWACAELYQCLSCLSSLLHCGHITETHIEVHRPATALASSAYNKSIFLNPPASGGRGAEKERFSCPSFWHSLHCHSNSLPMRHLSDEMEAPVRWRSLNKSCVRCG
jgi:hypothetical protein